MSEEVYWNIMLADWQKERSMTTRETDAGKETSAQKKNKINC